MHPRISTDAVPYRTSGLLRLLQSENNFRPGYRRDIDGLRAVAILFVVAFHAFPAALPGGFVGVDIFFVISGFLISSIIFGSLRRGDFSFAEFYAHRVRRIFPALLAVLLTCFVVGRYVLRPDEFSLLAEHLTSGAAFFQNFALWKEHGYFDAASHSKPLLHLWSLAIEEQFYLAYPLLVWATWRMGLNVLAVILVLCGVSFALCVHGTYIDLDPVGTFYLPQTRFWELFAGAALAWLHTYPATNEIQRAKEVLGKYRHVASVVGFALLTFALLWVEEGPQFPGWHAAIPVSGAFLMLAAGPNGFMNRWVLANRPMVLVGLVSYPLYLWHWPILSFAWIVESGHPSTLVRAGALSLSVALAWLTFVAIEKPIRFGKKSAIRTVALCGALGAIALVGQYSAAPPSGANGSARVATRLDPYCRETFNPKGNLCRVAKEAPPTTLVVGDSHAYRLFLGLEEEQFRGAMAGNVMLFGQTACPFPAPASSECGRFFSDVYALIESNPSIETVVLASVTIRHYIQSKRFDGIAAPYEAWGGLLHRDLTRLRQLQKKVVVIVDNPMLDFDPKQCDVRSFRITKTTPRSDCAISAAAYFERERLYRDVLFGVVHRFPEVSVVDTSKVFCSQSRCSAIKAGKLLYDDDNHLSVFGIRLVLEQLVPLIDHRTRGGE